MGLFRSKETVNPDSEHRDWELVSMIARDALKEQKKARRWGIFFKSLAFLYVFVVLLALMAGQNSKELLGPQAEHTAIVRVNGLIAEDEDSNAGTVVTGLRSAFKNEHAVAVLIVINSPGGSPVQAGYINDEIVRLRGEYPNKKLYAVIKDVGASGGYYIAAAADEIYADKASLVGSIGVTAAGFGFVDLMAKLGVERRNFTAGEHKAFLDPFAPLKKDEKQFWEQVLGSTHQQFIKVVEAGRGDRLSADADLYSGLIWNGEQALELGLIDGLASPGGVARDVIGQDNVHDYTPVISPLEELTRRLGTSIGVGLGQVMGLSVEAPIMLR